MKLFFSRLINLLCCTKSSRSTVSRPNVDVDPVETDGEKIAPTRDLHNPPASEAIKLEAADGDSSSTNGWVGATQLPARSTDLIDAPWLPQNSVASGRRHPTPDAHFASRFALCARELIGLRLATLYHDFVRCVPRRLASRAFQPGDWPLHPDYSWGEIAEAIVLEQV
jgi:hypothetical protein